jgi:exosortase
MTNSQKRVAILSSVLGVVLAWAYWPTFGEIAVRWSTSTIYSHGYLVPVFAGFLLWHRRSMIRSESLEPSWWGLPWIALGAAIHLFGAYFFHDWASAASILPILIGIAISLGGDKLFRWSWPAIGFLVFMLPLPHRVETWLAHPLQRLATIGSTYVLQTLGFAAVAEGNIIIMEDSRIGVVEACNGLGMLVTFFALATGVAMLMRSRFIDKAVILLSAVPIALLSNVIRITVTGILTETVGTTIAGVDVHDFLGYFMAPLGLGMLWIEKLILDRLLLEQPDNEEVFRFAEMNPATQRSADMTTRSDRVVLKQTERLSPVSD